MKQVIIKTLLLSTLLIPILLHAENGYNLWLQYTPIENTSIKQQYTYQLQSFSISGDSETASIIRSELKSAFKGMLGIDIPETGDGDLKIQLDKINDLGSEGFRIASKTNQPLTITANTEIGLLYGTFHLLKIMQLQQSITNLNIQESPKIQHRVLNHWDNLDRTSERGYAGFSIWDWHRLPDYLDPRYSDYARANASIGINGTVLTNVNANALVLTPTYIEKVKALADLFRPYGIKVYLTARFSAPIEIGGLSTADPLNKEVAKWWTDKVKEIYKEIPDFGGFLVKANSEGQPGPHNYGRTHADGANMLARALKPYGGIVMWRAFVYSEEKPDDRAKQAYDEFVPLDGTFDDNVMVQVKNGPIDFQPREPFHPMFGATPKTPLMMEFQITQEYLGQATNLVYLAPMYKECLNSDTYAKGRGSEVAKVIDGSLFNHQLTGIAGVANIGTDINWTGHPMAQVNWYAFGRLAWNPELSSEEIAREWIGQTFGNDPKITKPILEIMLRSWEAAVHYMTPLGLHHLMGTGHHYGPAPWVSNLGRPDWNPVYYHKADAEGIGFDRTKTGSNAVNQYFTPNNEIFGSLKKCPEKFLLWFHHVPWQYKMASGNTLWNELALTYQEGVNTVRSMQKKWQSLEGKIDDERFSEVKMLLKIQEKEAIWWKDASLLYFSTFSKLPLPEGVESPKHDLEYYQSLSFPFAPGIRPQW